MRLTNIEASNVLAIKEVNLKLSTAVALICGRNGSLKSSLYDVVSMALAQRPMRAVVLKKDMGMLINDTTGAKAGGGLVQFDNDPEKCYTFNLPKGEFTAPEVPAFSPEMIGVALNGQNFARMSPDDRRVFLRTLTKVNASRETIEPMMLAAGADQAKIEIMIPNLRSGFPAAEEFCKERALDAKREWQRTTGRKAYGKDVADAWEAPMPDAPAGDAAALRQQVEQAELAVTTANQAIGAIQQAAAKAAEDASKRIKLAEAPAKLASIQEQIPLAEKELAEFLPKVQALRERAKGTVRVGLVHDMARFINGLRASITTAEAGVEQAKLMSAYEKEHGPLGAAGAVDAEAKAELPTYEKSLTVLQNRVENLKRDLASATQAVGQYEALAPAAEVGETSAELDEVKGLLEQAKADKVAATNALLDIEAALKNRAEAKQKDIGAKKHHKDVIEWLLLASLVAPDGIPGTLLAAALSPFNAMLAQAAVDTGWPAVVISNDMQITVGGRAYQLQSESYQWRADAMIAQCVATMSGTKVLMLDRFDVLDMPARTQLFNWLDTLADPEVGDIDTAIIFGTLKALPTQGLPDSFSTFWVEDGTVAQAHVPQSQPQAEAA